LKSLNKPLVPVEGKTVLLRTSAAAINKSSDKLANSPAVAPKDEEIDKAQKMANNMKVVRGHCTVQLGLIETVNEIVFTHYSSLSTSHLGKLLDSLEACYLFSSSTNNNAILQAKLQKTGMLELLLRQETMAISYYIRILFRMYAETVKDAEWRNQIAEDRLIGRCKNVLQEYLEKSADQNSQKETYLKRVVMSYTQIIVQVLKGLNDLTDTQFSKHLPLFFPLLSELVLTESKDIRAVLKDTFARLGKRLFAQ